MRGYAGDGILNLAEVFIVNRTYRRYYIRCLSVITGINNDCG